MFRIEKKIDIDPPSHEKRDIVGFLKNWGDYVPILNIFGNFPLLYCNSELPHWVSKKEWDYINSIYRGQIVNSFYPIYMGKTVSKGYKRPYGQPRWGKDVGKSYIKEDVYAILPGAVFNLSKKRFDWICTVHKDDIPELFEKFMGHNHINILEDWITVFVDREMKGTLIEKKFLRNTINKTEFENYHHIYEGLDNFILPVTKTDLITSLLDENNNLTDMFEIEKEYSESIKEIKETMVLRE